MQKNKYNILSMFISYLVAVLWSESLCMEKSSQKLQSAHTSLLELKRDLSISLHHDAMQPNHQKMRAISEHEVKEHPYSAILSLECHFAHGPGCTGTGFLIGDGIVLTAAHVVYGQHGFAKNIECYFSRYGDNPSKMVNVKKYIFPVSYTSHLKLYQRYHKLQQQYQELHLQYLQFHEPYEEILNNNVEHRDCASLFEIKALKDEYHLTTKEFQSLVTNTHAPILSRLSDIIKYWSDKTTSHDYALLYLNLENNQLQHFDTVPFDNVECADSAYYLCGYPEDDYTTGGNKKHSGHKSPYGITLPLLDRTKGDVLSFGAPNYDKETTPGYDEKNALYSGMSGCPIINNEKVVGILTSSMLKEKKVFGCAFTQEKLDIIEKCKEALKQENSQIVCGFTNKECEEIRDTKDLEAKRKGNLQEVDNCNIQ